MDQPPLLQAIYPTFAPLPVPMVEHLRVRLERAKRATPSTSWDVLRREVAEKRQVAFFYMDPYIRAGKQRRESGGLPYSTAWLLRTLTAHAPGRTPISQQTLSHWNGRGLVRYREHGVPDYANAAALYIARMIDSGERNFLPSTISEEEPQWWCFAQTTKETPAFSCPVPLPKEMPPATLLWTPWAGAAWDSEWALVGENSGAIRWAGVGKGRLGYQRWAVTPEELHAWDPELAPLLRALPRGDAVAYQEMLYTLATLSLQRLARGRLGPTGR